MTPPGPGSGPDAGDLPDTGAPPWLRTLLVLGFLLILSGTAMVAWSRRHRPGEIA